MRAGLMWDKCRFEAAQTSSDDIGGTNVAWAPQFEAWGWLRMERGREALEAGRLEASNLAVLTIRSNERARTITPGMRVVRREENWQIRSVVEGPGRDRTLELLVERGTAT